MPRKVARAYDGDTGERLALLDLRGKGSKARSKANRKGRFALMYQAECQDLLTDSELSHFEARLLWFMMSHADWENRLMMTQSMMAKSFKVPPSQISRALRSVEARGYVRCIERGVYEINPLYFYKGDDEEQDQAVEQTHALFSIPGGRT
jgi:Helix-turn-helix domain